MPRAEIASEQAVYTLGLLHAELAGRLLANKREAIRLRTAMMQVEAVVKMLQPASTSPASQRSAATRATLGSSAGRCSGARWTCCGGLRPRVTAREIADALVADKAPEATRKQAIDLQAAILVALRKRNGGMVVGEGAPARWRLESA
jgi:hypothetical protein